MGLRVLVFIGIALVWLVFATFFPVVATVVAVLLLLTAIAEITGLGSDERPPWVTFSAITTGLIGVLIAAVRNQPRDEGNLFGSPSSLVILLWIVGSYLLYSWQQLRNALALIEREAGRLIEVLPRPEDRQRLADLRAVAATARAHPDAVAGLVEWVRHQASRRPS